MREKTLIILRHGNTFEPDELPRRIGSTDLPLTPQGEAQIRETADCLFKKQLIPELILSAPLRRTKRSAELLQEKMPANILYLSELSEIDHGPDENKTEDEVRTRLGPAWVQWQEHGIVPQDWGADEQALLMRWEQIAALCRASFRDIDTIVCVTSQGIARFAPLYVKHPQARTQAFRLNTAHYSILQQHAPDSWTIKAWNQN